MIFPTGNWAAAISPARPNSAGPSPTPIASLGKVRKNSTANVAANASRLSRLNGIANMKNPNTASALYFKSLRRLAAGLAPVALSACSTLPNTPAEFNGQASEPAAEVRLAFSPVRVAMQSGVDALLAGDARRANRDFNLAIARDMKNPALHAANALAYQLRMRGGERDLFDLAETGYLVALEQRHDFQTSALQLAHLYLENKRYQQAQRAAAYALELDRSSIEALHVLASASYSQGDINLALWAMERARHSAPLDKSGIAMTPVIYAAAGLNQEAESFIANNQLELGPQSSERLHKRVAQWKSVHDAIPAAPPANPLVPAIPNAPGSGEAIVESAGQDAQGPLAYAWSDCVQQINAAGQYSVNQTAAPGDETTAMPSLPSPCKGRTLPRMAIIDVVILRTTELSTSSHGINLLDNLAITVQQSSNRSQISSNSADTSISNTLATNVGLGTSAGGAIAYSLNIANVTGQTTEVIARPSLLVLDRQPSQFFSGSNVSIGLTGAVGGSSTLNQVNVGVSLSVTPTFVDADQMLLSVKAARTFFEPITGSSTFSQSLQTSRNMVSAATKVRLDETLVLSGLTDHESIRGVSGVPLLKDIPGLQYLFSKNSAQNFDKTVLILITPRRAQSYGSALDKTTVLPTNESTEPAMLQKTRARAIRELDSKWPTLYHAIRPMKQNERAFAVRTHDICIADWKQISRLKDITQAAIDSLQ
jgi:Tfp pilus assembly protein PilF